MALMIAVDKAPKVVTERPAAIIAIFSAAATIVLATTTDVITSGLWLVPAAIGAILVVFTAPRTTVRGWAIAYAIATAFTASAATAPTTVQTAGRYFAILILIAALVRGRTAPTTKRGSATSVLIILWIVISAASTLLFSPDSNAFVSSIFRLIGPSLAVFAASKFSLVELSTFLRVLIGFGIWESSIAIIDTFVVGIPVWGYGLLITGQRDVNTILGGSLYREQAAAGHGILLGVIVGAALIACWLPASRIPRTFAFIFTIMLGIALVLSSTRSAILAVLVAFAFLLIVASKSLGARIRNLGLIAAVGIFTFANGSINKYIGTLGEALADSGSYSHRQGAFESIPGLVSGLPGINVLLGNGADSAARLFAQGFLQQDGLLVIDNQAVTTFVETGLFGTLVLLTICVYAFLRGRPDMTALFLFCLVMFMSFDFFLWSGPTMLFFALFGVSGSAALRTSPSAVPVPGSERTVKTV